MLDTGWVLHTLERIYPVHNIKDKKKVLVQYIHSTKIYSYVSSGGSGGKPMK